MTVKYMSSVVEKPRYTLYLTQLECPKLHCVTDTYMLCS